MKSKAAGDRPLVSIALVILATLWVSLFLWRKTFSYVNIGGLYVIELSVLAAMAAFAVYVFSRSELAFAIPRDGVLRMSLFFATALVLYSMVRAVFSDSISAKGLIPGVYPLYLVIVTVLAANASSATLARAAHFFVLCFLLAPTVGYLNGFLVDLGLVGSIESPGWTYVYGVTLALSLILIRKPLLSTTLFGIYFLFTLFLFQRGAFVDFALAWLAVFVAARWRDRIRLSKAALIRGVLVGAIGILLAPFAFELITGGQYGRFLVTPWNVIQFFLSIFGSSVDLVGVIGTRQHRLEMWTEITKLVFSSFPTALFGFGFGGEVGDALGVSFRAPHNGFITILYRGGVIGLLLFVWLLISLFVMFARKLRAVPSDHQQWRHAAVGLIILGSLVGDSLAGTILDSPFTSMMFYIQVGILAALLSRYGAGERPTGRQTDGQRAAAADAST